MFLKFLSFASFVAISVTTVTGDGNHGCPYGSTPVIIDFDYRADGYPTYAGEYVDYQWSDYGVEFSGHRRVKKNSPRVGAAEALKIFDSAHPTGGDYDLGSPNAKCPQCGIHGKECKGKGEGKDNCRPQNKVVIIDSKGSTEPDDWVHGGHIEINFKYAVEHVIGFGFLDLECPSTSEYYFLDYYGNVIHTGDIYCNSDNGWSFQKPDYYYGSSIHSIKLNMFGSFALTDLKFCMPNTACDDYYYKCPYY